MEEKILSCLFSLYTYIYYMHYEQFLHTRVDAAGRNHEQQLFLVDMKQDLAAWLFSALAIKALEQYLPAWKKVLIIGGKDWFATGGQCNDCGYVPKCKHCDIPIAYHRDAAGQSFGLCHICKTSYSALVSCGNCGSYEVDFFWTGLQKIQEHIHTIHSTSSTLLISATDVSSLPKIKKVQEQLTHTQCVLATSILQIAPVDRKPDVVIVVRADSALSVPDRKVSEHCFTMLSTIVQQYACPIIIQAYNATHHAILSACRQDMTGFREVENEFRKNYIYPPFGELAILLYRHEIEETMFTRVHKLYQELLYLQQQETFDGEIFATPPLVYKMFDKYRYNIVVKWKAIRPFLEKAFVALKIRDHWFKVDRLPENIT